MKSSQEKEFVALSAVSKLIRNFELCHLYDGNAFYVILLHSFLPC